MRTEDLPWFAIWPNQPYHGWPWRESLISGAIVFVFMVGAQLSRELFDDFWLGLLPSIAAGLIVIAALLAVTALWMLRVRRVRRAGGHAFMAPCGAIIVERLRRLDVDVREDAVRRAVLTVDNEGIALKDAQGDALWSLPAARIATVDPGWVPIARARPAAAVVVGVRPRSGDGTPTRIALPVYGELNLRLLRRMRAAAEALGAAWYPNGSDWRVTGRRAGGDAAR